jgi:hypothetical protein
VITLSKNATSVPTVTVGTVVPPGAVFVATQDGSDYPGQLEGGKHAVLETNGGRLELTTMSSLRSAVTAPGTYLNQTDVDRLGGAEQNQTLRKYGFRDTIGKAFGGAGAILLIVTLLGLLAAASGLFLALKGEGSTSAATVAERSQTLLSWVTEPADQLEGSDQAKVAAARRALHRREAMAQSCLRSIAGGEASEVKPGGVSCKTDSPPWWKDKERGALLGLAIGLLTTLLGLFGVGEKFGFGKSPAG